MQSALLLTAFTAIVISLIWARLRFFKIESSKARLGSLLYDPAVAVQILGVYYYELSGGYSGLIPHYVAIGIYILALAFFWWGIRTAKSLEFALSSRVGNIITSGPFAIVRHPFYSSYILIWLSSSLLLNSIFLWITLTYLVSFYFVSARSEEKMILSSANSEEYKAYSLKVGMFTPRIIQWKNWS